MLGLIKDVAAIAPDASGTDRLMAQAGRSRPTILASSGDEQGDGGALTWLGRVLVAHHHDGGLPLCVVPVEPVGFDEAGDARYLEDWTCRSSTPERSRLGRTRRRTCAWHARNAKLSGFPTS